jgi:hypothetical protein
VSIDVDVGVVAPAGDGNVHPGDNVTRQQRWPWAEQSRFPASNRDFPRRQRVLVYRGLGGSS